MTKQSPVTVDPLTSLVSTFLQIFLKVKLGQIWETPTPRRPQTPPQRQAETDD
jgi:hypothetical protein